MSDNQQKPGCLGALVAGLAGLVGGAGGTEIAHFLNLANKCTYNPSMPSACTYDVSEPLVLIGGFILGALVVGEIAYEYIKSQQPREKPRYRVSVFPTRR